MPKYIETQHKKMFWQICKLFWNILVSSSHTPRLLGEIAEKVAMYDIRVISTLTSCTTLREAIPDIAIGPLFYGACTIVPLEEKRWLLNEAIQNKHLPDALERVEWALRMGAPVNTVQDPTIVRGTDTLPLEHAIDMRWPGAVRLLMEYGADWDTEIPYSDEHLNTPRKYLAECIQEQEEFLVALGTLQTYADEDANYTSNDAVYEYEDNDETDDDATVEDDHETTAENDDAVAEDVDEIVTENEGESVVENEGESVVENEDETVVENEGESVVENEDETVVENEGESVAENEGESVAENEGETVVEDEGETVVEDEDKIVAENDGKTTAENDESV
jgi:hypothetical protein